MRLRLVLAATPFAATLAAPGPRCVPDQVPPPAHVVAIDDPPSPGEATESAPLGASWADFPGPAEAAAP